MIACILAVLILLIAYWLGSGVFRLLKLNSTPDEECVLGTGLGLSVLAYAVLAAGLMGRLTAQVLWGLLIAAAVIGLLSLKGSRNSLKLDLTGWFKQAGWPFLFCLILALLSLIAAFTGVLTPETGNDSLCYHLNLPKLFLRSKTISVIPFESNSVHPLLMELLYTLGLALSGDTLAKCFHFSMGFLAAAAIVTFVRKRGDWFWGGITALLFLTTPGILNQMSLTYIEVAMAYFNIAFLLSLYRWVETRQSGWILISGLFAGFCMSVKYLGALCLPIAPFVILFSKNSPKKNISDLLFFIAAAFLASGFWYIRNTWLFRNPVYPYFYSVFGTGDPLIHTHYFGVGVEASLKNFFLLPWNLTLHPEWFEGYGDQIGPFYLALLPSVFLAVVFFPFGGWILASAGIYLFGWFKMGQILRYLFPLLPPLAVLYAIGLSHFQWNRVLRFLMILLLTAILGLHTALAFYHYRRPIRSIVTAQKPDAYLSEEERTFKLARWMSKNLAHSAKILAADEVHLYYFDQPIVREVQYSFANHYEELPHPEEVLQKLKQDGFTHILFAGKHKGGASADGPHDIPTLIREGKIAPYLKNIHEETGIDRSGESFHYTLYEIRYPEAR